MEPKITNKILINYTHELEWKGSTQEIMQTNIIFLDAKVKPI